jgi:hypothetical protein
LARRLSAEVVMARQPEVVVRALEPGNLVAAGQILMIASA